MTRWKQRLTVWHVFSRFPCYCNKGRRILCEIYKYSKLYFSNVATPPCVCKFYEEVSLSFLTIVYVYYDITPAELQVGFNFILSNDTSKHYISGTTLEPHWLIILVVQVTLRILNEIFGWNRWPLSCISDVCSIIRVYYCIDLRLHMYIENTTSTHEGFLSHRHDRGGYMHLLKQNNRCVAWRGQKVIHIMIKVLQWKIIHQDMGSCACSYQNPMLLERLWYGH